MILFLSKASYKFWDGIFIFINKSEYDLGYLSAIPQPFASNIEALDARGAVAFLKYADNNVLVY